MSDLPTLAAATETTGAARLRALLTLRQAVRTEIAAERYRLAVRDEMTLIDAAADLYGLDADDVLSGSRVRRVVRARQVACWLLWHSGYTYSHIGRVLDRDHATAMYAVQRVELDASQRTLARTLLGQLRDAA